MTPHEYDSELAEVIELPQAASISAVTNRLAISERLRRRRFELVPVTAPATGVQGREPGESTTPAELAELISSIATVGLLQPLLLEETPAGLQVVAGERRLRAMRWGLVNLPENPNFVQAPAVICPGPLTEEERRVWQLIENLARTDLRPGELAAALLFERCAVLASILDDNDAPVPESVWTIEDPVRRWETINRHRIARELHQVGAPWNRVIGRLGLQLTAERAKQLVRALRALPPELSTDMDAHGIQLASRLNYLRLDRGRSDAASAIWESLKNRNSTHLLTSAINVATEHDDLDADEIVERAEQRKLDADAARSATNRGDTLKDDTPDGDESELDTTQIDDAVVSRATAGIDELLVHLRAGGVLPRFAVGSVRLRLRELADLLERPCEPVGAHPATESVG